MKRKFSLYHFFKQVIAEFIDDNVMKYSAALAYYTVFSLAPMLIIIISICGALFGKEAVIVFSRWGKVVRDANIRVN